MAVYKPNLNLLIQAINSFVWQRESRAELVISVNGPVDFPVKRTLREFAAKRGSRARVRVSFGESNIGISNALNLALSKARGDFIAVLDQDDLLHPNSLMTCIEYLKNDPDADALYTDHERIDLKNRILETRKKPSFSPELLFSHMYIGHFFMVRRQVLESLGGYRSEYDGAQDYDLALRLLDQGARFSHLSKTLYSWRSWSGSLTQTKFKNKNSPKNSFEAGQRALQNHFAEAQSCIEEIKRSNWATQNGLGLFDIEFNDRGPEVTIIVPTREHPQLITSCVNSVLDKTSYKNFRILIIDHLNRSKEARDAIAALGNDERVSVLAYSDDEFNFSKMINVGVAFSDSEYFILLNDDVEVLSKNWLTQMMGWMRLSPGEIGAVGAKSVYPDGSVENAGICESVYRGGLPGSAFRGVSKSSLSYGFRLQVASNVTAVSASCLLSKKTYWKSVGGFDETNTPVEYNDYDYCVRLSKMGLRIVSDASVEVKHRERQSRGRKGDIIACRSITARARGKNTQERFLPEFVNYGLKSSDFLKSGKSNRSLLIYSRFRGLTGAPLIADELYRGLLKEFDGVVNLRYESDFLDPGDSSKPRWLRDLKLKKEFSRYLSKNSFGSLLVVSFEGFPVVDVAARAGIPVVWSIQESRMPLIGDLQKSALVRPEVRRALKSADRLVFPSRFSAKAFFQYAQQDQVRIIPTPIIPRDFDSSRADDGAWRRKSTDYVFLNVGTVCPRKGQDLLFNAFCKIVIAHPKRSFKLKFVGDDTSVWANKLKTKVAKLGMSKIVEFCGERIDTAGFYSEADCYVLSSREEAYPRVVLEAMQASLPIVAAPSFGVKEMLTDEVDSLFFRSGNAIDLSRKMERVMLNPSLAFEMGKNARIRFLEINDSSGYLNQYRSLVESVLCPR